MANLMQGDSIADEGECRAALTYLMPRGSLTGWNDVRNASESAYRPPYCYFTRNLVLSKITLYSANPANKGECAGPYQCLCRQRNATAGSGSETMAPSPVPSWFPSPRNSDGFFVYLLEGTCRSYSGLAAVTTASGCETAARALQLNVGSAIIDNREALPLPDFPPFCYSPVGTNYLKINENGANYGKCSKAYGCLCVVATASPSWATVAPTNSDKFSSLTPTFDPTSTSPTSVPSLAPTFVSYVVPPITELIEQCGLRNRSLTIVTATSTRSKLS
jgi:hypothetical protein